MIKRHKCKNSVTIVHEPIRHFRSVAIGIWVRAGSGDELEGEAGIAHFIEHMLFKGTASRTARVIAEEFDRLGGDLNAFTSKEETCFYVTVLNEHAEKALTILADMIFNSLFDEVEINKEKSVVLEEIAAVEDTPDDDVHEQLWATMYQAHPLGRPILGQEETITTFDREKILNFMERVYKPDKVVISVAGNYEDTLIHLIEERFGSFKATSDLKSEVLIKAPKFHPGILLKGKEIEQTHMCLGFPGLKIKDKRMYDLVILDSIVGGTMSSRLFQEVREERGLAYSIYSYYSSYEHGGAYAIYGGTSPEKTTELYRTINHVIDSVLNDGVTEREVQNSKAQVKGEFLLGLESSESRMYRNGKNELFSLGHKTDEEVVSRINLVERANVHELAKVIFQEARAISIIAPEASLAGIDFSRG